jgi:hypothetical protein
VRLFEIDLHVQRPSTARTLEEGDKLIQHIAAQPNVRRERITATMNRVEPQPGRPGTDVLKAKQMSFIPLSAEDLGDMTLIRAEVPGKRRMRQPHHAVRVWVATCGD